MLMYTMTALLLAMRAESKLLLFDFFTYVNFGYFGHSFNLLTLIFGSDSTISKIYKMDKLILLDLWREYPLSMLKAKEGSVSILGSLTVIAILALVLIKRKRFLANLKNLKPNQIQKTKAMYGAILCFTLSTFVESMGMIGYAQSHIKMLNLQGCMALVLLLCKNALCQAVLLKFWQDMLALKLAKLSNSNLFSLKSNILLDSIVKTQLAPQADNDSSEVQGPSVTLGRFQSEKTVKSSVNAEKKTLKNQLRKHKKSKKKRKTHHKKKNSSDLESNRKSLIDKKSLSSEISVEPFSITENENGMAAFEVEKSDQPVKKSKFHKKSKRSKSKKSLRKTNEYKKTSTMSRDSQISTEDSEAQEVAQQGKEVAELVFKEPLFYLAFEKRNVKKLYLYIRYGNDMLKKKVTPPELTIESFCVRFIAWTIFSSVSGVIGLFSLFLLPRDLDPAGYMKIGQIPILICLILNKIVWKMINDSPNTWIINKNAADLVSQLESISILLTVIYLLILIGIMSYNTFDKIGKQTTFFRGLRRKFGAEQLTHSRYRRNISRDSERKRLKHNKLEKRDLGNESTVGLNRVSEPDAFGSLDNMGIF